MSQAVITDDAPREFDRPNLKAEYEAFERELTTNRTKLAAALPSHIDVDMFIRCAMVAIQRDFDLLLPVHRRSLFLALQDAATDGLLPDRREGVLIIRYDTKAKCQQVCWQPMVWGLMKLARNTGEITSITAHIVYEGEPFRVTLGDEEKIEHERVLECAGAGLDKAVAVYGIARMKDGTLIRRHMLASRVRAIKAASRATKGPWSGAFEDEMWIKTVLRFLAKWLDLSSESDAMQRFRQAIERVDDINVAGDQEAEAAAQPDPTKDKLSNIETALGQAALPAPSPIPGMTITPPEPVCTAPREEQKAPDALMVDPKARKDADYILAQLPKITKKSEVEMMLRHQAIAKIITRLKDHHPLIYSEVMDACADRVGALS